MFTNRREGGDPTLVTYPFLTDKQNMKLSALLREGPSTRQIIVALEDTCASPVMARVNDSLTNQLLRYTVVVTLLHCEGACNERVIAKEIWGIHDHNPTADPRIRMAKRLLNRKLSEYYKLDGRASMIGFCFPYGFVPDIRHRGGAVLIDAFTCHTQRAERRYGEVFQTTLAGRIESVRGLSIHSTCPPKPCPQMFQLSGSFAFGADHLHVTVYVTKLASGELVFEKHSSCHAGGTLRLAADFADDLAGRLQPHVECQLGSAAALAGADAVGQLDQLQDEDPGLPCSYIP